MRDILEKLLPYYESALATIRDMDELSTIRVFVDLQYIGRGVCMCAREVFGTGALYGSEDVEKNATYKGTYWGPTPDSVDTKDEIIAALLTRIDIMRKLLTQ